MKYQANTQPLEVVLSGGIGPKDGKRYLIGQLVSATLSSGGLSSTSYKWSISDGNPFEFYTASDSKAEVLELNEEKLKRDSVGFHFRTPVLGNATVSCQVHLATPSGALPAEGLDVTPSRDCSVEAPTFSLQTEIGTVKPDHDTDPYEMRLTGATLNDENGNPIKNPDGVTIVAGSIWRGAVTTPADFGAGGGWNFTQVVVPYRVIKTPGVTHNWSANGQKGLDGQFGYDPVFPGLYPADGSKHAAWDSPFQGLDPNKVWTDVEVNDTYAVYILYMPPGAGSAFVPLKGMPWLWRGKARIGSSSKWELYDTAATSTVVPDYPKHPKWEQNNKVENGHWDPPLP